MENKEFQKFLLNLPEIETYLFYRNEINFYEN